MVEWGWKMGAPHVTVASSHGKVACILYTGKAINIRNKYLIRSSNNSGGSGERAGKEKTHARKRNPSTLSKPTTQPTI